MRLWQVMVTGATVVYKDIGAKVGNWGMWWNAENVVECDGMRRMWWNVENVVECDGM